MENELKKLAATMRDMSDMVGDHHWQAAKAIDLLAQRDAEIARRIQGVNLLIEDLERRDTTIDQLRVRLAALESQQAASVGGDLAEALRAEHAIGLELALSIMTQHRKETGGVHISALKRLESVARQARAALSPAGGGVVMPGRKRVDPYRYNPSVDGWNACLDEFTRLNAKPQANSQEADK